MVVVNQLSNWSAPSPDCPVKPAGVKTLETELFDWSGVPTFELVEPLVRGDASDDIEPLARA